MIDTIWSGTTRQRACLAIAGCAVLVSFAMTTPALAQDPPRFGLSGAPDYYDGEVDAVLGEEITLYVIATGPSADEPIPYAMKRFEWLLLGPC